MYTEHAQRLGDGTGRDTRGNQAGNSQWKQKRMSGRKGGWQEEAEVEAQVEEVGKLA